MPQVSLSDIETLLRALEEQPIPGSDALHAAARLRQHLEQAKASEATPSLAHEPDLTTQRSGGTLGSCTLHVCTSCRPPGAPREPQENRPGFKLYQELRTMLDESPLRHHVEIKPAQCLSLCPRPCGIAISAPGGWSYLFGEQQPGETAGDILDCVSTYIATGDGQLPREQRPKTLRTSILGRVPPFDGGQ